jgi:hypothetical protein
MDSIVPRHFFKKKRKPFRKEHGRFLRIENDFKHWELDECLSQYFKTDICPFFDYPRKPGLNGDKFKIGVEKVVRSFKKHVGMDGEFYFDNYDIDDSLKVGTKHNYWFLLESLAAFPVIPVVSVDRSPEHIAAVAKLKSDGKVQSDIIGFRVTPEIFEDYSVIEDEITSELGPVCRLQCNRPCFRLSGMHEA